MKLLEFLKLNKTKKDVTIIEKNGKKYRVTVEIGQSEVLKIAEALEIEKLVEEENDVI